MFLQKILVLCALSLLTTSCAAQTSYSSSYIAPSLSIGSRQDTVPNLFAGVTLSATAFNPQADSVSAVLNVAEPLETEISVVPLAGGSPLRTFQPMYVESSLNVVWDGRDDRGRPVPPGAYHFEFDAPGHTLMSDPLHVIDKRIVVSLEEQRLYAYEGNKLVLQTAITTGGPELPTPEGSFHVMDKTSPLVMYSPWPKGSPYWFPDSVTQYALEFFENASYGLYIHDASWRHDFGPGSNALVGTPGQDGTGTHGCINVPLDAEKTLFDWAVVGTPVVVEA